MTSERKGGQKGGQAYLIEKKRIRESLVGFFNP